MFEKKPGFSIHYIDKTPQGIHFWCEICEYNDYLVSPDMVDKNGTYLRGNKCCKKYTASPEISLAFQMIDQRNQLYHEKNKANDTKRNVNGYLALGAAPLFLGVLTQSSGLIGIGMTTTFICVAVYMFGYFRK